MSQHPLAYLARRFPQLYVEPSDYSEEAYKRAFTRGEAPENASLDHFHTTPDDWLRICETPSGEVEALFLANRDDFETFLRCVLYRAQRRTISPTVGAMTIAGLPDWEVLRAKQHELMEEYGENWAEEYRAFIGEPDKYKITMLLLSEGPNSNVPASEVGLSEDEWLERSREIRLYHELAHVVCRRLLPDDILPVWDEVTADFHGILRAFGAYDATLALRLLGVKDRAYIGGRLSEYLTDEQFDRVDEIADALDLACRELERQTSGADISESYDLLLKFKQNPYVMI